MKDVLLSTGIDIGTSTTQLVFSKLKIENLASDLSVPRMEIVDKEIIYCSEIYETPLLESDVIDGAGIRALIVSEYATAGIDHKDIDTGAVIITGETANKRNAREIVLQCADFAGDFVVAAAGPDLESMISGKGAGADMFSKTQHTSIVHMDIGGGTSNLSVFENGICTDVGCLDIGGRILKVDRQQNITYISPKLKQLIIRHQMNISEGMKADAARLQPLIRKLADILEMSVGLKACDEDYALMVTNHGLSRHLQTEYISFSGGVAEYIYKNHISDFLYGDIGILLGRAIRTSALFTQKRVVESREKIRATVVGAGLHTTKLSGSTVLTAADILPIKNIPVIRIEAYEEFCTDEKIVYTADEQMRYGQNIAVGNEKNRSIINVDGIIRAITRKMAWYDLNHSKAAEKNDRKATERVLRNPAMAGVPPVAIALHGMQSPSFGQVQAYAQAICEAAAHWRMPLIVITEADMGKVLGQCLRGLTGGMKKIICLDSIALNQGDYIDIGRPAAAGMTVPVIVKTLVFNGGSSLWSGCTDGYT